MMQAMRSAAAYLVLGVTVILTACVAPVPAATSPIAVTSLASPAGNGSAQPQLSTSSRGVLLSWIEKAGSRATLKFAERSASGWTQPAAVASGDDWFVNWADVPSVIRLGDGTLVAHWLQKSAPDTYAYDVRLSHSRDDGRTWSPSFTPHQDGTKTEHGFASLFQLGDGLGLVWLDGRTEGAMSVRFGAFDRAWRQSAEVPVDGRVCECCPTSAVVTADGPIAAFRDRSDEEVRNIAVARYVDGRWTEPRAVHDDGWKIPACPVNGPMLSARGRNVAIAWFTMQQEQGRAFVAFSSDSGRTFGEPVRVDDQGSLGRVDVELLVDGSALATWIEFAEKRAQFRARRIEPSGSRSAAVTVSALEGSRASGYPRVAMHGDELIFAWTESSDGQLRVQTASARLTDVSSSR
jgi:hypothetical protein